MGEARHPGRGGLPGAVRGAGGEEGPPQEAEGAGQGRPHALPRDG